MRDVRTIGGLLEARAAAAASCRLQLAPGRRYVVLR
jgi:hypothetical protein